MVWVWVWKILPKNVKFFNFSPSGQKVPGSKAGQPLIYCRLKESSGQGPSLLFTIESGLRNSLIEILSNFSFIYAGV